MKKYKYFFKSDTDKEAIGVVKAKNEKEQLLKEIQSLQLPPKKED